MIALYYPSHLPCSFSVYHHHHQSGSLNSLITANPEPNTQSFRFIYFNRKMDDSAFGKGDNTLTSDFIPKNCSYCISTRFSRIVQKSNVVER